MSINCTENCGSLRKVERVFVSPDDIRTIGRGVLWFAAGLVSQAAVVIATLRTTVAAVVRHMIRKCFILSCGNLPTQFATMFRQPL